MAPDSDPLPPSPPKPLRLWTGIVSIVCGAAAALMLLVLEFAFRNWGAPSEWDIPGGMYVVVQVILIWVFTLLGLAFGLPAALSRRSNRVLGACGLLLNVGILLYFRLHSGR